MREKVRLQRALAALILEHRAASEASLREITED
jgi:hypothetical protein